MSFRYDMRGKTTQQQAIVRKNDEAEKLRKQQRIEEEINCSATEKNGDYEGVIFTKGSKTILELRVSGTTIVNGPAGLKDINIHDWLCRTGSKFIEQVKEFEILMITSYDVQNKELITNWKNLRREVSE